MAAGKSSILPQREHKRISAAVEAAEASSGLQFCVYVGKGADASREHALEVFEALALYDIPAVLLWLAPGLHRVEILTSPSARERIPDSVCASAIDAARASFSARRFADGVDIALRLLADHAGAGAEGVEHPDIIDE